MHFAPPPFYMGKFSEMFRCASAYLLAYPRVLNALKYTKYSYGIQTLA